MLPKKLKEIKLVFYKLCVKFIDIIDGYLFKSYISNTANTSISTLAVGLLVIY